MSAHVMHGASDATMMQNVDTDQFNDKNSDEECYEILIKGGNVYRKISPSPSSLRNPGSSLNISKMAQERLKKE